MFIHMCIHVRTTMQIKLLVSQWAFRASQFSPKVIKKEDFRETLPSLSVIVEEENNRNNESIVVNKLRHSCFVHVFWMNA